MADEDTTSNVLDSLTMGELIELEEYTGIPLDQMGQPGAMKGRSTVGMAWLIKRRSDPTVKVGDVEAMTAAQIAEVMDMDPTESPSGD